MPRMKQTPLTDVYETIGTNIRKAMFDADITISETAQLAGIAERSMYRKLKDIKTFTIEELFAVAKVTETNISELVGAAK